jgi:hypothetical protein
MRKVKVIVLALFLILTSIVGYYIYAKFYPLHTVDGVDLISNDAIFIYETKEPIKSWNQLVNQPFWGSLSNIHNIKSAEDQLLRLDSLFGQSGNLDRIIKGNKFVISLHAVSKDELDFLFSIALSKSQANEFFDVIKNNIDPKSLKSIRKYSGISIYEIQSPQMNQPISYARLGNTFIGSYTSFLIEESIRQLKSPDDNNFKTSYQGLFQAQPEPTGLGILRITGKGLLKLFNVITKDYTPAVSDVEQNDIAANLELNFSQDKIIFKGVSVFENDKKVNFYSPSPWKSNNFDHLISNRTTYLQQYLLASGETLRSISNASFVPKETLLGDIEKKLAQNNFFSLLTGHLAYQIFESEDPMSYDKILLLKCKDVEQSFSLLKGFLSTEKENNKTALSSDFYANKEILLLNIDEFPAHLFEGKFSGFKNTFVATIDSVLIFANSNKAMKLFLDDIKQDNVWGKSIQRKNVVNNYIENSGLLINFNVSKYWENIRANSSPNWKVFFQKHSSELQIFDQVSLSLKSLQNKHYVNIELALEEKRPNSATSLTISETKEVKLPYQLNYGPKSIQNFIDKGLDFVIQDEMRILHLLNMDGEVVFSKSLDSEIVSEIFQIDYYKNGKLQLLFATKGRLYLVDRLGESIPGFPKGFPSEEVTHLNLVDYDNNKDYRYFIGTDEGNIYLLDKNGNPLEGWSPKKISGKLAVKPSHHRVAGLGDQMVLMTENGDLFICNRRGEALFGSPIQLAQSIQNPYLILERGSAKDARLTTLSSTGEVIQVNMKGELLYRNQLLKPEKDSEFHLLLDQNQNRYLHVVKDFSKVSVYNQEYKPLFEINYLSESIDFQFFSFGGDKNVFIIIDKIQDFIFLYNLKGELLSAKPINGNKKIDLRFQASSNEYLIYSAVGNSFIEYRLPL